MKNLLGKFLSTFLLGAFIFGSQAMFVRAETSTESSRFWENNLQTGVTLRSYNKLKIGMSFRNCNRIIGFEAEEISRNVGGGKVFTAVKWEGDDYAIITAVFRDNILTNKYKANLR